MTERRLALDNIDMEILDFVTRNPGTSKERLKNELIEKGLCSYVVGHKRIDGLAKNGMIMCTKEKHSRYNAYMLYPNSDDARSRLIVALKRFERTYLILVSKVRQYVESRKSGTSFASSSEINDLIDRTLEIYFIASDEYLLASRWVWFQLVKNRAMLSSLFEHVFTRLAEIHSKLHDELAKIDQQDRLLEMTLRRGAGAKKLLWESPAWDKVEGRREVNACFAGIYGIHDLMERKPAGRHGISHSEGS